VYWEWELRGAVAEVNGTATSYEAFDYGPEIKRIEFDSSATAMQLARLALAVEPIRWKQATLCS
jgi:hypothetical protein